MRILSTRVAQMMNHPSKSSPATHYHGEVETHGDSREKIATEARV